MEDKEKNTQIPVIRLDRQLKYEGNILKIYEDRVLANGHEARWDFIHHDGAAAVLPVADDGKILMVRQYRNALDRYTLEIPAGKPKVLSTMPSSSYEIVRTSKDASEIHILDPEAFWSNTKYLIIQTN